MNWHRCESSKMGIILEYNVPLNWYSWKKKKICWFFTLSNFVSLPRKLNNPYYHILHPSLGKLAMGGHLFWSSVLILFARAKVPIEIHRYIKIRMLLRKSFTLCQMAGRLVQGILLLSGKLWAFGFCFRFLVHWPIIVVTKRLKILSMVRHK